MSLKERSNSEPVNWLSSKGTAETSPCPSTIGKMVFTILLERFKEVSLRDLWGALREIRLELILAQEFAGRVMSILNC